MSDLHSSLLRIASDLPKGDPTRREILAAIKAAKHPLDGVRRHTLMPKSIARKIPKMRAQENVDDPIVYLKLFSPYSNFTWYITEFDGRDEMFGFVSRSGGRSGELGYISLKELEGLNRNGLPLVERDMYWGNPRPLSKAKGS